MKIQRSDDDIEKTIQDYSNTIFKIAFSYTKNKEISEDILQNVLLKYMTSLYSFNDSEHKKAWIIRVTINECKKYYRFLQYQFRLEKNFSPALEPDEKHDIYYAVMSLPHKYRIVVHLYYYEDLSINEISKVLHMKENTIMSLLHRARKKLKLIMEVEYGY